MMKKLMQKATTWLMIVCMVIGFMPVFGSAMAAEGRPVQPFADSAALQSEGELEGLRSDNFFDLLWDSLKAIVANLQSVSVDELLNLPANMMDDVVTYIFAAFKIIGVNIDSLYAKLAAVFSFL